jgi:hypothetical protein
MRGAYISGAFCTACSEDSLKDQGHFTGLYTVNNGVMLVIGAAIGAVAALSDEMPSFVYGIFSTMQLHRRCRGFILLHRLACMGRPRHSSGLIFCWMALR